jgi:Diacylglycerol kinase catalytic domain
MPGIGIISNPYAKVNKNNPSHNTVMWYILGNRGQFEVTQSLLDLSKVCLEFQERDLDIIGIVGGDGTVGLCLSAIYSAYKNKNLPKILLLRGGTLNVLAQNLGIFGKPKSILDDFLKKYHGTENIAETNVHSLNVNGRLGFLFANGVASRFLKQFYANKTNAFGAGLFLAKTASDVLLNGKLNGVAKEILTIESYNLKVDSNAEECQKISSLVLASTVPKMPFGIPLFERLNTNNAQAEAHFFFSSQTALVTDVAKVLFRKNLTAENCKKIIFEKMQMNYSGVAEYSLDGDILEAQNGEIKIEIGPKFCFVSPYGKAIN